MKKEQFNNGVMILGDCLDVLPHLKDNRVEITITSPPYNLQGAKERQYTNKTSRYMSKKLNHFYNEIGCEKAYQKEQRLVLDEMVRISNSSVFYNHKVRFAWHNRNKYRTTHNMYHPIHWINHPIWSEIIWDRAGIGNPTSRYHVCDERIYQIGRPKKWSNPRELKNIWRINPTRNGVHPCTFPHELVWNCMQTTTDEGDIVLDPYMGSGTTAIVAIQNNRRFIGIEKDPKFFELACENISKQESQLTLNFGE